MATTTKGGPTTAERVRSVCARRSDAMLALAGSDPTPVSVHHLQPDGDVAVVVPSESAAYTLSWLASTSGLPAVLELTDHSPLDLREKVRSLVWLRGTLLPLCADHAREVADDVAASNPDPGLLDLGHGSVLLLLRVDSAVVADASGADAVRVDDLLAAAPDPFWDIESQWLTHLDEDHPELLDLLARKLPPHLRRGAVRPLGITRYGLQLRVEHPCPAVDPGHDGDNHNGEDKDIWMPFAQPVDDATGVSRALRMLVGCPFVNGLRARNG
ncbi:DUF2470 domain-containing protein [Rhodococcus sp. HNM0569]|uniref:DUF2470 domain-containing protein n=1 Tax=Rhodococcus sp. HNM0569 TaxID=2716340 RepID=UPI00146CE59E|nr:DUF2470 domain-containing protein [Rhodococcus sp. HNM0569]NLU85057.1 DUF2470 domain-containing protein [Rhodococcus sp. HNM0569]